MKIGSLRLLVVELMLVAGLMSMGSANGFAAGLGATCGGFAGIPCESGLWCEQRPGFCQGADIQGSCERTPEICSLNYNPVCGCDSKTYGNDCERRRARVAKSHDGPCK